MKNAAYLSGAIAVLALLFVWTGWADADSGVNKALRRGNEQFALAEYGGALAFYETGLAEGPENKALSFNAAQAAYFLGDFEKAAQYYENAEGSVDKYLNAGNIFFRAGGAMEDANQKAQCYAQAMQIYKEGIIEYPQDVPLKYNYETVRALLDELTEEMEQEGGESQETQENQGGQEQDNQDAQGQDAQGQESESAENDGAEQGDNTEQGEGAEQEGNAGEARDGGQGDGAEAYTQNDGAYDPDQEAIARILEMLESQEEESLKNNQGAVGGKVEANGW